MDWMGDVYDGEGKLDCPKCDGRIGSFVWHGNQCSCGYVDYIGNECRFCI